MDEIVARAMQKWPDVPNVYGWLRLDRRGNWLVKGRSLGADGAPLFERIGNPAVVEFIGRNYARDDAGRWYFQNGPQRVFVRLDYLPLVYRLGGGADLGLVAHTGLPAGAPRAAWLDEAGALIVDAAPGPGLLDDRDLSALADAFVDGAGASVDEDLHSAAARGSLRVGIAGATVGVATIAAASVAARFAFDPVPAPPPGQPEC